VAIAWTLLITLFIVLPLVAGTFLFIRLKARDPVERVLLSLSPLAAGVALWMIVFAIASGPMFERNAGKLAPVVAMVRGHPQDYALYQDPDTGVMSGWTDGPVAALVYLPCALLSTPTPSIILGIIISVLCGFAPAVWFHLLATPPRSHERKLVDRIIPLLALFLFIWICMTHEPLRRATLMISSDAPALGFAACSCAVLVHRRNWLTMTLSATCAALAVWARPAMFAFLIIPPAYLFVVDSRRLALRYVAALGGALLVISSLVILAFGPARNMWFHMVRLPWMHAWRDEGDGRFVVLWRGFCELLSDAAEPIALLIVVVTLAMVTRAWRLRGPDEARKWLTENPWAMLLAAALVLVPSSVMGYAKGRDADHSFALTNYFLTLTATLSAASLIARMPALPRGGEALSRFARSALCAVLLIKTGQFALAGGTFYRMTWRIANPRDNPEELVYRYVQRSEGALYFPANALGTLLAKGRLYHVESGVGDRYAARMSPAEDQARAHVPTGTAFVAYPPDAQRFGALQLFPGATESLAVAELPGFTLFTEPATAARLRGSPSRNSGGPPPR
jgi:hypothetical protein